MHSGEAAQAAVLHPGDRGTEVSFVQEQLTRLGYPISVADGVFGTETASAVESFQLDNGIAADGVVGDQTWESLRRGNPATSRGARGRSSAESIIRTGKLFLGVPYVWGGTTPAGFDCSGFTQYVFALNGIRLPRTADAQFEVGSPVSYENLQPGDMVFFSTYEPGPSHNGIYLGNGMFINSSSSQGVSIASMDNAYWSSRYIGAKRIIR